MSKDMSSTGTPSSNFSSYGTYNITKDLDITLPDTTVKIKRVEKGVFSYIKTDSDGNKTEKMIPIKSNEMRIEIAPIRPLNHPARRTRYVFLKFDKDIHLSHDSSSSIFVQCPIEIGVFLVHGSEKESLDWITCNAANSRFGLYGSPDTGFLCKYAKVLLATGYDDSVSFMEGVMKITIKNTLNSGQIVNKIIFPITDNSIYYKDSKAMIDGIKVTLKKQLAVKVADIDIDPVDTNWKKSPTLEDTTTSTGTEIRLE